MGAASSASRRRSRTGPTREVERRVLGIADTLAAIFARAARDGEPTSAVADRMAEERIARAKAPAKAAE